VLFFGSCIYILVCLELELVRVDFLCADATAQMVTASTHTTTKMSDAVLNSGIVELGDVALITETESLP
jgi:hypothetical protein